MTINIQAVRFDADQKLVEHIQGKLQKLATFHDRIIAIDVFLRLDNVVHKIKDKIVEIRIIVPNQTFFVKNSSKAFELSFENAYDSVCTKLKKEKQKVAA